MEHQVNCIRRIKTIDMHTGGEPLRVVLEGIPEIKGNNVLERRKYCIEHLDYLRKFLMFEPRGHADMYGCYIVPPNDEGADFGIIFMHNEGYSTMCGHATIAIAKLAVLQGWVQKRSPETTVIIDAPCGRLKAWVNKDGTVRFQNVPSFVFKKNESLFIDGIGNLYFDIAYGGAFYALIDASEVRLKITPENIRTFIAHAQMIKSEINKQLSIDHPFEQDLSFLYGCIFTEPHEDPNIHSRNVCVFADGEVDRCPTGSGVSARMAQFIENDEVVLNEEVIIESIIGSRFAVNASRKENYGPFHAIIPEVRGTAFITGYHEFVLEENDEIEEGFLIR